MAYCYKCGDDYSDKRASLGYRTCLHCGDKEASIEAHRRTKCVALLIQRVPISMSVM
jgi:hypothetical protein